MRTFAAAIVIISSFIQAPHAFSSIAVGRRGAKVDETFVNPDTSTVIEEACKEAANRMQRVKVPVSSDVHPEGEVGISFVHWPSTGANSKMPIVLVHGFDSSCLEYRRFGKPLSERGIDTYAVDLLGWGFTQLEGVTSFSAKAKVEELNSFLKETFGNKPFCIAGASLGGAAAIEVAAKNPNCAGLVLIDAQGFVDGIGPMASLPKPLAKLGVGVLKSVPLRSSANQMSYFDKKTFATDDAVTIGRLHCVQQELWSDALVNFMQSGGFSPSSLVPQIRVPTLVLWGRQDTILDGNEFANKFIENIENSSLKWIEESGHVPHLEQPAVASESISTFLESITLKTGSDEKVIANAQTDNTGRNVFLAGASVTLLAGMMADLLPVH